MTRTTLRHDSPSERSTATGVIVSGALMGALGGALMAAFLMIDAALEKTDPVLPLELFGATLVGPEALGGGSAAVLPGVLLHLLVSAALGVPFAALVPNDFPTGSASVLGVGYAFVIMALMTSYVIPAANPLLEEHLHSFGGAWVIARAIFGATLGFIPWLRRSMAGAGRWRHAR